MRWSGGGSSTVEAARRDGVYGTSKDVPLVGRGPVNFRSGIGQGLKMARRPKEKACYAISGRSCMQIMQASESLIRSVIMLLIIKLANSCERCTSASSGSACVTLLLHKSN